MPIRYQCDTCGSTLNIKDELAGSAGKCPKCKSAFVVPEPTAEDADTRKVAAAKEATVRKPPTEPLKPKKATFAKPKARRSKDDDFDPMAVLMGDEPATPKGRGRRSSAPPPLSDDEIPNDFALDLELGDDDPDEPPVRKSKKRKRVQFDSDDDVDVHSSHSASATATAMLSGGASAGAKDLLTRTMEESRARASRIDDHQPGDGEATLRDYLNEYGLKAVGILAALIVGSYGLYRLSDLAMGGGGIDLPDLGRVYGVVTLDGKPLEGANVTFTPSDSELRIAEGKKGKLRASTSFTNADGEYDLYYTEDVRGAAATEHRVIITKIDSEGRFVTPADYADYSMNMKTVESGTNEFNFDLHSDAAGQPAKGGR